MNTEELKQALGKLIGELRTERQLSQEGLAFAAGIHRTTLGRIERGEMAPAFETLNKIAATLGYTFGALVEEAAQIGAGRERKLVPSLVHSYMNQDVPLPHGLTHDQLEIALNKALRVMNLLSSYLADGDIQVSAYSHLVSSIVTKALSEESQFVVNPVSAHPRLYNPNLAETDRDWGLEITATQKVGKGGELYEPRDSWVMVIVYLPIGTQLHLAQVEVAYITKENWSSKTNLTTRTATKTLRKHSVYLDPTLTQESVMDRVQTKKPSSQDG